MKRHPREEFKCPPAHTWDVEGGYEEIPIEKRKIQKKAAQILEDAAQYTFERSRDAGHSNDIISFNMRKCESIYTEALDMLIDTGLYTKELRKSFGPFDLDILDLIYTLWRFTVSEEDLEKYDG